MSLIFTIGHSTDTIDGFIGSLEHHGIDAVVDVRSNPYSRFVNQFNKEQLSASLRDKSIIYIPMGDSLGARYEARELLSEDGKVDFSKVVTTKRFQEGINRVETGIGKGYRLALMCSERNPIECHRFSLVSQYLRSRGYVISHIVGGDVFDHELLEGKLLDYYREYHRISTDIREIRKRHFLQSSIFDSDSADKADLYVMLNRLVGYNPTEAKREAV